MVIKMIKQKIETEHCSKIKEGAYIQRIYYKFRVDLLNGILCVRENDGTKTKNKTKTATTNLSRNLKTLTS